MSIRDTLLDTVFRSAWWRFAHLWRPMAAWTLLVWALVSVILVPALSLVLARVVFRGDRILIGNEDLLVWLLYPEGLAYLIGAGGLAIMGAVVRYAGLFRILTDDLSQRPVSIRQTLFELLPDLPALLRLCMAVIAFILFLLLPLVASIGIIYLLWLGEHDINYYLLVQPPEWHKALIAATMVGTGWVVAAVYIVLRSLLVLPAYLDGHRPAYIALQQAWKRTRGRAARILWLLFLCVSAWLALRTLAHACLFFLAAIGVKSLSATVSSVMPLILATGAYAAGSLGLDILLSFIGFSFSATVLTKFYYEDTDLHAIAPPLPLNLSRLPRKVVSFLGIWLRPWRALPILAVLLGVSIGMSGWLLHWLPQRGAFTVTAHRAGAHLATENTLAALERAIAAGADFAEIDVQSTRDGKVVVFHDADLMRLAGDPRRIARTDYAALRNVALKAGSGEASLEERRLATLDEFLERAQGRIGLNIELKYYQPDPSLAKRVLEQVLARGMEEEVMVMSLDLNAVRQLRRLAPKMTVGYVTAASVGNLTRLPIQFLAASQSVATEQLIRSAHRRGLTVHVWTLNRASRIAEAIERGADGVITDDPGLAVRVRRELMELSTPERLLLKFQYILLDTE
jgi:glycerophosphoryl diester phosphodiesterase